MGRNARCSHHLCSENTDNQQGPCVLLLLTHGKFVFVPVFLRSHLGRKVVKSIGLERWIRRRRDHRSPASARRRSQPRARVATPSPPSYVPRPLRRNAIWILFIETVSCVVVTMILFFCVFVFGRDVGRAEEGVARTSQPLLGQPYIKLGCWSYWKRMASRCFADMSRTYYPRPTLGEMKVSDSFCTPILTIYVYI